MVTTFNQKDMISFGRFLLSKERKQKFTETHTDDMIPLEERMSEVYGADLANWLTERDQEKRKSVISIKEPVEFVESEFYHLVMKDATGRCHYFNKDGSYDGWGEDVDESPRIGSVLAKFECTGTEEEAHDEDAGCVHVHLSPCISEEDDNKEWAYYTPGGSMSLTINKEVPAANFFSVGEKYLIELKRFSE